MYDVTKPVFFVGSGRSGTTLIYDIVARHREFAWFSNWTNLAPDYPQLSLLSRVVSYGPNSWVRQQRWWPEPTMEANNILDKCGIRSLIWEKRRPLTASDVSPQARACLRRQISQHMRFQGKPRFVHKNVDNSLRILYLNEIFPDAKFIHIIRDGRAVAFSLSKVAFWSSMNLWWDGTNTSAAERDGRDPLVLCGEYWTRYVSHANAALKEISDDRCLSIKYEDFVHDPIHTVHRIISFCELPWDKRISLDINARNIRNLNARWIDSVDPKSLKRLEASIRETLSSFGYDEVFAA